MAAQLTKPPAYRQSLIAAFDTCPLRARFSLEDDRRTPGQMAARGTLVHRALHKAVREMWKNGERTYSVEQGMELLTRVLCQTDVPSEEVVPLKMEEMRWARVIMTKWCENTVLDARKVLATEERLFADLLLPTGKTVQLTGQLDLLLADPPDGLIVVDYKTGFRRPKKPRSTTDPVKVEEEGLGLTELGWVQNLIYAFLCFASFPSIERVIFREIHVLWGEERQARTERWQAERRTDILGAQVALLDQAIEEGPASQRWMASAGAHCALCPRPWSCPVLDDEQLNVHTEAGRRRIAHEWIVAGETKDRRRTVLDGLVELHGPIEVAHSEGRRVVGWDYDPKGKRSFGVFEPRNIPDSPYDEMLVTATREAGTLAE